MAYNKKAVCASLENLSKSNFEKFRQALVDRRGDRRVPFSRVEDKNHLEVTNVLVSTFTEDGAPSVAAELLREIGCFDEAQNLDEEISKHSSKAPLDKQRPAGGPPGGPDDEKHFVDRHKMELIKRLTNINPILDHLLEKKVIKDEVYEEIRAVKSNQQKMREIYIQALKSGNRAKDIFLEALAENDPYLVEDLKENK
ncbi:apoptosis-associated speck-like protein containing a CARD [Dunckerocampus dactyliophorus]|uniref:apoptosis-associated speck-like protein containing a CARD n=1 Tax=Dunckerocampus dactyliophorus TaxID=161453 RepID=UPI002406669F|nr:apoptosis-associated speck-like protein containing a CARD [Dunckerocampus dactyliophorus]